MTPALLLAELLVGAGLPALALALATHARRSAWLLRACTTLDADLRFVRVRFTGRALLLAQAGTAAAALALALATHSALPVTLAAAALLLPGRLLANAKARRVARIEGQVQPWLVALASSLRTTPALGDALATTAKLCPAPLRQEVELLLREYELGSPLDRALGDAADRIGSRSVRAAMWTLSIARATGGDLSRCLEQSAAALREMARLDGVVRTKTAEGKAQAAMIAGLPVPLFGILHWIDPEFLSPLFGSVTGYGVLALAGALWLSAMLLARRILRVDV